MAELLLRKSAPWFGEKTAVQTKERKNMIHHFILWRYTDAAESYGKEVLIAELNRRFQALIGQIQGMLSVHIRPCDVKGEPVL